MKIVFLAGADSIHSHKWINFFADKGHQIYWFSFHDSPYKIINNIYFVKINGQNRIISLIKAIVLLRRLIRRESPDIIHAHYAGTYGLVGALSGFRNFITTAWGSDILIAGRAWATRLLVKYVLHRSNILTCDAEHMVKAMQKLGVGSAKIRVIYFGIDTKHFRPVAKDDKLIASWGCSKDDFLIISLRSLEPIYDIETLIRAVPIVLASVPNAKFLIAGTGSSENTLKALIKELSLDNYIRFLGRYDNNRLPSYLCSADIYVSTSLSDAGIAASTAEAMACGVPVVVSDSGENHLWINDGQNGFIIPKKSPKILAKRIIALAKDVQLAKSIGMAGRDIIVEKNDYATEMQKMEKICENFESVHLKIDRKVAW